MLVRYYYIRATVMCTCNSFRIIALLVVCLHLFKADCHQVISAYKCILSKDSFVKLTDVTLDECVNACVGRHACTSLGYRRQMNFCELHKEPISASDGTEDSSCIFIERNDMDTTDANKCQCKHIGHVCNPTSGQCDIAECGQLDLPNGKVYGNRHYIGAKRGVSCNNGFIERTGTKRVVCNDTGEWDPTPICDTADIATPPPPINTAPRDTQTNAATTLVNPNTSTTALFREYYCPVTASSLPNYTQFDLHNDGIRVENRTSIIFATKGKNDAYILLQNDRNIYTNNVVEIVLGGWNNTKSVIRNVSQGTNQTEYMGSVLDPNSYQSFWISWNNKCVVVGKGSNVGVNAIMNGCGFNYNITGMRISYGYGSEGYLKFDFVRSVTYLGCYDDQHLLRLLEEMHLVSDWMTMKMCFEHCNSRGMRFFLTEYTSHCFCGNVLKDYEKRPESECNMACAGNRSEICGGFWRGSVYDSMTLEWCPNGWLHYGGSCYYFSPDLQTWQDAKVECQNLSSSLVEVDDSSENSFLVENARKINGSFWIGLTDQGSNGNFVWTGSQRLLGNDSFSDWYPGQPDSSSEDCTRIFYGFEFKWNNVDCTNVHHFVCEK